MQLPTIDIDAIPMLDTAVGLFGSLTAAGAASKPSIFEISVTVVLIIYD